MAVAKIIWVDDEIESLQSQKMFLENKGYEVQTFTNGFDAIDYVKENQVDVVLIDESMPGITGLETLAKIKEINQSLPVVLITKNETENLMDEAIGSQISDTFQDKFCPEFSCFGKPETCFSVKNPFVKNINRDDLICHPQSAAQGLIVMQAKIISKPNYCASFHKPCIQKMYT